MIPKKIHYCWFGRNPKSDDILYYIESWKKHCSDYEFIEWNEDNFDINSNMYVKEAYDAKKWAFITDYVRLWVIFTYGGIYMDTDVEVLKPLDSFLKHPAFSGFESNSTITTGIMAGEKDNKWFKIQLSYYDNKHFLLEDGTYDLTTNVKTITNLTKQNYSINLDNSFQDLGDIVFYSSEYFCPKDNQTGLLHITENSHTIHHFNGSWATKNHKNFANTRRFLKRKFGKKIGSVLLVIPFIYWQIKDNGIKKTIQKFIHRVCLFFK